MLTQQGTNSPQTNASNRQSQLLLKRLVCAASNSSVGSFSLAFCHLVRLASLTVTAEHITNALASNTLRFIATVSKHHVNTVATG